MYDLFSNEKIIYICLIVAFPKNKKKRIKNIALFK